MRILFSVSYSKILDIPEGTFAGHEITVSPRTSDWDKRGIRKYFHFTAEAIRIGRQARRFDAVVLCNLGIEAFVLGKLRRVVCPRSTMICVDLLMPRESRLVKLVRTWIKGLDRFVCIRSGDIPILERRFGVPASICRFVHFPITSKVTQTQTSEGDYIYSAGWAHRDWKTLIEALSTLPYRAILSAGAALDVAEHLRERITVLPMQSPEEGRKLMANARVVVLALEDTDLPSGPLVLLDAMTSGKPVVATNVNGNRDYVRDEHTALVVPSRDKAAMSSAIQRLMEDDEFRHCIGKAARDDVCERFTMDNFMREVTGVCEEAASQRLRP